MTATPDQQARHLQQEADRLGTPAATLAAALQSGILQTSQSDDGTTVVTLPEAPPWLKRPGTQGHAESAALAAEGHTIPATEGILVAVLENPSEEPAELTFQNTRGRGRRPAEWTTTVAPGTTCRVIPLTIGRQGAAHLEPGQTRVHTDGNGRPSISWRQHTPGDGWLPTSQRQGEPQALVSAGLHITGPTVPVTAEIELVIFGSPGTTVNVEAVSTDGAYWHLIHLGPVTQSRTTLRTPLRRGAEYSLIIQASGRWQIALTHRDGQPPAPEDPTDAARARFASTEFRQFSDWCLTAQHQPLPAAAATVQEYLEHLAADSPSTLIYEMAARHISHMHQASGHPDPVQSPQVRETLHRLAQAESRAGDASVPFNARQLDVLREFTARTPRGDLRNRRIRETARITLARATNGNETQLDELTWDNVHFTQTGEACLSLTAAQGGRANLHLGRIEATDLRMYFDSLGDPTGPLFTSYSTPQALNQLASEAGMGTGYHRFSVMLGRMNDALALGVVENLTETVLGPGNSDDAPDTGECTHRVQELSLMLARKPTLPGTGR